MKKALSLVFAGLITLASCSSEEKKPTPKPQGKPRLTAAEIKQAALVTKMDFEREILAQKALWYLTAVGDSLVSTETMENGKYDFGRAFPAAIRQIENKFSTSAFRVIAGITVDQASSEIAAESNILVVDTLGGKTRMSSSKPKK